MTVHDRRDRNYRKNIVFMLVNAIITLHTYKLYIEKLQYIKYIFTNNLRKVEERNNSRN